jgi:O-antigen ligase
MGRDTRPPLHPLEAALVGITALHLCFLPWALGTMHIWSQLTSAGLAVTGFVLAAMPRRDSDRFAPNSPARQWPLARLSRNPVFWGGLILLGYIAVQGCNPAWRYMSNADSWWLEPVAHLAWLPSGVAAPFELSNPWRALLVYGSLWLVVCSVAGGFVRRQSYRVLFTVLAGNAFLLAAFGFVQLLSGTKQIFWTYRPSNGGFSGSFIYPNHAGAYLNLMVALAAGLALWLYRRGRHGVEKPSSARWFTVVTAGTGLMVILSYSRASIISLLAFTALFGCAIAFRLFRRSRPGGSERPEWLPLVLTLAGFLAIGLISINSTKVWGRFSELFSDPARASLDRRQARAAAADMLRDHWVLGWGAGCFRHGFPLYAQHYPDIYNSGSDRRKLWEHAHNDLLEIPLELGAVGMVPLAVILGGTAWSLYRRRFWRNALSFSLVLGGVLTCLHAGVDFVFQNPAVLLTWGVLLTGALRWAELDDPVLRRAGLAAPDT